VRLAGRSALVTGSSRGIGRAIALALAAEGARVTVNSRTADGAADAVVSEIAARGGAAQAVPADVGRRAELITLLDRAEEFGEGLDILVSNAGGSASLTPIADSSIEEWEQVTFLNQRAVFELLHLAAPRVRDGGRVVVISSSMAASPFAGAALYAGAKAAIEVYARALAFELGPRGITVNAVAPGLTDTEAMRTVVPDARREAVVARTPLGRLGRPEDIGDVVTFLASDEGGWMTGQVVRAGGGVT
jgi:3-oxoacyl-[acyl-carrier protein] reductase